jgi:hypothetical protein
VYEDDNDLDGQAEEMEDYLLGLGLTPRQARRAARMNRRYPGQSTSLPGGATAGSPGPDFFGHALAHPELIGFRPSGWTDRQFEDALRRALGQPNYKLTARATFIAGTDVDGTADLQSQSYNFLGYKIAWSPNLTANARAYVGSLKQAQRFPLSDDNVPVRLHTLLGAPDSGPDQCFTTWAIIVPNEGVQVQIRAEGVIALAHSVDVTYHGWLLGEGKR